jgi:hypothetical protein
VAVAAGHTWSNRRAAVRRSHPTRGGDPFDRAYLRVGPLAAGPTFFADAACGPRPVSSRRLLVAVVGCVPAPGGAWNWEAPCPSPDPACRAWNWGGPAAVASQGPAGPPVKASGRRGPPRFHSGGDGASRWALSCTGGASGKATVSRFWKGWGYCYAILC